MVNDTSVSVVGLGKLGLGFAACLADRGFRVIGVDRNAEVVAQVNDGRAPFHEPGLAFTLARVRGRLTATTGCRDAIRECDTTFVITATPSHEDGTFSSQQVEEALAELGAELRTSDKGWHLFVVGSTVMPGCAAERFIPCLEMAAGRKHDQGFSYCYNPEFVALGNVLAGYKQPDVVVIGESSKEAGDRLAAIHGRLCVNKPHVARMSVVNAELAKICLNTFITAKISFANMMAELCERIPGADVDVLSAALGADRRISPLFLKGGLAYGGPCFPRDTQALKALARRLGLDPRLPTAIDGENEHHQARLLDLVLREARRTKDATVGILGLAFKPDSAVLSGSTGMLLARTLHDQGLTVVGHDPLAQVQARAQLGSWLRVVGTVEACLDQARVVVLTHQSRPWADAVTAHQPDRRVTLVDPWRMVNRAAVSPLLRVIFLGRNEPGEHLRPGRDAPGGAVS